MPQVAVTVAGRVYRMACGEGEEEHLQGLARTVDERIGAMRGQFGEIGDQRMTIMAAITLADDLSETRKRLAALEAQVASLAQARTALDARIEAMGTTVAARIEEAATRIQGVARALDGEAGD